MRMVDSTPCAQGPPSRKACARRSTSCGESRRVFQRLVDNAIAFSEFEQNCALLFTQVIGTANGKPDGLKAEAHAILHPLTEACAAVSVGVVGDVAMLTGTSALASARGKADESEVLGIAHELHARDILQLLRHGLR